ncbi:MAG: tetratricopeptide repeat protein [Holophaga sp.]|nr:tetratricopeptide repeat protein [Holophaga sp.]
MAEPIAPDPQLEQTLQTATELHLAGLLEQAEAGYRQVLAGHPEHPVALHRLGVLALQRGSLEPALDLLGRVVALDPAAWRSHCSLGQTFTALGRMAEARAAFQKAARLNPGCLEAWMGAGAACQALGLGQEALTAFTQAAALRPDHAEAQNNLGIALQDLGRTAEAVQAFQRALAAQEDYPIAHNNLGNALLLDRRPEPAMEQLRRTVARWPEYADAWYNLGNAAFAGCRFQEAAEAYGRTLALVPEHLPARNNLGNVLQAQGRNEAALDSYLEALRLDPGFVDAYNNASSAARALGRMDEAERLLEAAVAARPDYAVSHCNLGNLFKDTGRMDQAVRSFRRALELDPSDSVTHSNLAYAVSFLPGFDAHAILRENLDWNRAHVQPGPAPQHPNDPDPERRLRIGYVSPDFREHCLTLFTLRTLAHHDRSRFEIFCYARVPKPDDYTRQFISLADHWRDTRAQTDQDVAELVRADRIDVLVDITQHMSNGRPLMFARKPAPVQTTWLAYPGTTGIAAMDYRITDRYLDPPGEHDDWYSETSIRLPDTYWCYDPLTAEPQPGPLPALRNGHVTFGSLNNFCKVHPAVLDLWAQVMMAVPGSRLLLLAQPGAHRQRVLDRLAEGGVEPGRVAFAPFQPRLDYLALYRQIDLGLDTFPYNGHTTSLDAYWMGVPVVTRTGGTVVGRAGWSQLSNLHLRELAGATDEAFIQIAVDLAQDLPRLAQLRAGLRARMEASPLMDSERFTRNLETAYRKMWRHWCENQVI